ncbi:MAG: hypothetical protein ABR608_06770 [Pseudonocardiaceae bacterium]
MSDRGDEFAMPAEGEGAAGTDDDEFAMPPVPRAVRLVFDYEGDDVRLVSRQPVEMVVPPTDPVSGQEAELGSWVEVRSGQEATLYRRVIPGLFRADTEVFSPDPQYSVSRAPLDVPAGTVSVVVPELAEADHIALVSSARPSRAEAVGAEGAPAAAVEVARFAFGPQGGQR